MKEKTLVTQAVLTSLDHLTLIIILTNPRAQVFFVSNSRYNVP